MTGKTYGFMFLITKDAVQLQRMELTCCALLLQTKTLNSEYDSETIKELIFYVRFSPSFFI